MAGIKVYGNPISTAAQRVLATLYEKELEFEFINIDLASGEQKKEPFISLSPFSLVPAYQEGDDLTLFESRAITEYISQKYNKAGTPNLTTTNPEMKVWMQVEVNQFDPPAAILCWEQVFKLVFGMTTDQSKVEASEAKLVKVLDVYEARLSKSKYLGGDEFTLADLHHIPNIHCLLGTPTKRFIECRPRVRAWAADITSRPAWSKFLAFKEQGALI